ncbi:spore cortex biosynthesis protein YabQ [Alicyclobacillus dauci]|uniref:Spore cortex biosynthesis protein YabQ n=1 Tax=Alicyclobacillus dauci TaxID=1475485 RepID=A0ABY6Z372_9BACL|nr:spore cortex biosynthesis protein YabQ [Alicyclobacillus dauci]WAH37339.1 spore cortex biosynthesis protein YabQ [Alicyclobacillus dauci]
MMDLFGNASYVIWMLAAGCAMGTTFDFYSTVTGATKYLRWLRPALDILFWVVSGLAVYYLTFITILGDFRLYTFLLLGVGYLVYRALFRRIVIGSAFAVVRFVKGLILFCGRVLYRLIGIPVIACVRVLYTLLHILYVIGCRIEDGVSAVIRVIFRIVFFPLRRYFHPEQPWRKKLRTVEQGFWEQLSNWLRKKPGSVS